MQISSLYTPSTSVLEVNLYFPALHLYIELDGPFHRTGTARSFNCKRDEHLQKKGIHVHRVHVLRNPVRNAVQETGNVLSSVGVRTYTGGV
jgi:very-short-patch-repair endonuclease